MVSLSHCVFPVLVPPQSIDVDSSRRPVPGRTPLRYVSGMAHILPAEPVGSLEEYTDRGGGTAMETARKVGPHGVIAAIRDSGLRGRGGAGFPTGIKWSGLAADDARVKFVICNAAEGEPGTFKDRAILRRNPDQVLEGLAVAAYATGARQMFVGVKEKFSLEHGRLIDAAASLSSAGLLGDADLTIVPWPDDYLFGEEKGLLEVIEGNDPLPRLVPPYVRGLFETPNGPTQPAAVNNVETLANVPHILANGSGWFRSLGTDDSPGTMVCTVGGDVAVEAVAEVELGTPLRWLVDEIGGGVRSGGRLKMVLSGVSNAPLTTEELETPISFEGMRRAGSGLGSAGFIVYDDTACAIGVAAAASSFLFRGSCGQCPPCKMGTNVITDRFQTIDDGDGSVQDLDEIAAWTMRVTDANRCGLGAGQQALARGIIERFFEDAVHHMDGGGCPSDRSHTITTIEDWDVAAGRFAYSPAALDDAPGA